MKDDRYLWDRSGEPDPDVERLEQVLGTLRHRRPPLGLLQGHRKAAGAEVPVVPTAAARSVRPAATWRGPAVLAALAAAVLLLIRLDWPEAGPARAHWTVERIEGIPTLGARALVGPSSLPDGKWLETGPGSRARLTEEAVGVVEVGPASRVRLVRARAGEHRLALERGVMRARIWASPGQFTVDTPSGTAIDLGCAYTLAVDGTGRAVLRVESGWVGLEHAGQESFVPTGATCRTRPGQGLGLPVLDDAPAAFTDALAVVEAAGHEAPRVALEATLATARRQDAFTLWHLLGRVDRSSSALVFDRLAELAPPPAGVDRERILARDGAALDAWWNSLDLGDAAWFRQFRARGVR